jgi:hypothetical protein
MWNHLEDLYLEEEDCYEVAGDWGGRIQVAMQSWKMKVNETVCQQ